MPRPLWSVKTHNDGKLVAVICNLTSMTTDLDFSTHFFHSEHFIVNIFEKKTITIDTQCGVYLHII